MILDIVTWPDPVLAAKAKPIDTVTPELDELIEKMIETMYEADGVGLAAPQIGQSIKLIVVDPTGPKARADLRIILNPEIVESAGEVDSEEGCLSCPELSVKVKRYERVKVAGLDRQGTAIEIDADGFLAIVLQHEIDHLEGMTLADRLGHLKKTLYKKKARKWKK